MAKRKELLAAGIVRDIRFANPKEAAKYQDAILGEYKVLDWHTCEDGTIIFRIVQQYNNSPLIQLYEEV